MTGAGSNGGSTGAEHGSPSVQVKESDIQAGHDHGIHHITKDANLGQGHIVTMSPGMLPAYLLNHDAVLQGMITPGNTAATVPNSGSETIVDYCRRQNFHFDADVIARYIAALLTKPFVILAGVSGTGMSRLAELVAEFYTRTNPSPPLASGAPVARRPPGRKTSAI